MHPQQLFQLYVVSNSGKRYWDCKLPCIEAQIELSSTFVYDYKMSTSGSSARNSHVTQALKQKQRSKETLLPFVTTYHPAVEDLKKTLMASGV